MVPLKPIVPRSECHVTKVLPSSHFSDWIFEYQLYIISTTVLHFEFLKDPENIGNHGPWLTCHCCMVYDCCCVLHRVSVKMFIHKRQLIRKSFGCNFLPSIFESLFDLFPNISFSHCRLCTAHLQTNYQISGLFWTLLWPQDIGVVGGKLACGNLAFKLCSLVRPCSFPRFARLEKIKIPRRELFISWLCSSATLAFFRLEPVQRKTKSFHHAI